MCGAPIDIDSDDDDSDGIGDGDGADDRGQERKRVHKKRTIS